MGAMGVYVVFGVILSMLFGDEASNPLTADEQEALLRSIGNWSHPTPEATIAAPPRPVETVAAGSSRIANEAFLHLVPHCARGACPAKDFSAWALTLIWDEGGELLSANSEGIECRFATSQAALRAALRLQTELQGSERRLGVEAVACSVASSISDTRRLA